LRRAPELPAASSTRSPGSVHSSSPAAIAADGAEDPRPNPPPTDGYRVDA